MVVEKYRVKSGRWEREKTKEEGKEGGGGMDQSEDGGEHAKITCAPCRHHLIEIPPPTP